MLQAYKNFWLNYTNFSGRSSRSDYWFAYLFQLIIFLPLTVFLASNMLSSFFVIFSYMDDSGNLVGITEDVLAAEILSEFFSPINLLIWAVILLYSLATIIPNLAIMSRRLRDAGFHWAFLFLAFVPYANLVLLVLLAFPTKEVAILQEPEVTTVVEETDDQLSSILSDLESSDQ